MKAKCKRSRLLSPRRWTREKTAAFSVGILIGVGLAVVWHHSRDAGGSVYDVSVVRYFFDVGEAEEAGQPGYEESAYDSAYERWLEGVRGGLSEAQDPDAFRYGVNGTGAAVSNSSRFIAGSEADFLFGKVPVVCVVFSPDPKSVPAVADTWGRHCNDLRFYHSPSRRSHLNASSDVEAVPEAGSEFGLICRALRRIWKSYSSSSSAEQKPWILVAPEDSFVLTENLRFYVAPLDGGTKALYIGHAMKFWGAVYNWANAGYALSWAALRRFVEEKFSSGDACDAGGKFWKNGDWYLGKHLASLGISPVDTRDHAGRGRFNAYSMKRLLFPGGVSSFERYWRDSYFGAPRDGPRCCSNFAITFAGVLSRTKMHQQHYIHHRLRPFSAGGKIGNVPPSNNLRGRDPSLTLSERLKEEALAHIFDPKLTTPKSWLRKPNDD